MTYDIHCKRCGRYLGSCARNTTIKLKCPNCKGLDTYRIVLLWGQNIKPIKDVRPHHSPTHLKGNK